MNLEILLDKNENNFYNINHSLYKNDEIKTNYEFNFSHNKNALDKNFNKTEYLSSVSGWNKNLKISWENIELTNDNIQDSWNYIFKLSGENNFFNYKAEVKDYFINLNYQSKDSLGIKIINLKK